MPKLIRCSKCQLEFETPGNSPTICPGCGKAFQPVRIVVSPKNPAATESFTGTIAAQPNYVADLKAKPAEKKSAPGAPAASGAKDTAEKSESPGEYRLQTDFAAGDGASPDEYRLQEIHAPDPPAPVILPADNEMPKPPDREAQPDAKTRATSSKPISVRPQLKDNLRSSPASRSTPPTRAPAAPGAAGEATSNLDDDDDEDDDNDAVPRVQPQAGNKAVHAWVWAFVGGGVVGVAGLILGAVFIYAKPREPARDTAVDRAAQVNLRAEIAQPAPELTGEQIYRKAASSVVLIVVRNADGNPVSQGTGFRIDDEIVRKMDPNAAKHDSRVCYILTNHHVVYGGANWEAHGEGGIVGDIFGTASFDKSLDLALVYVRMRTPQMPSTLTISQAPPAIGSNVYAIGNPLGLQNSFSKGIISGVRGDKIQTDAPVSPGSSGGPLLSQTGLVVGVVTSQIQGTSQNLNFAMSVPTIWRFLNTPFGFR
ncbi:MAG: trypsin-like peptidase domain-containing protein [Planctomycetia bacterium]|nr:trypsin-like peptidase domain-containing protein [Planctomycetia bacterium]